MTSMTSIVAMIAIIAVSVEYVQSHGYVEIPEAEFKNKKTSEWIVQIDPQWKGDWNNVKGDEGLVALYKELKASNKAKDIRTLLDSDTKLYGADCGYTNPDAKPKDPPKDGTAKFSRGIGHAGPCEIWLDDKMVLQNDDCQGAFGDGTVEYTSIFKPIDYSSCASGGCMFRFYWMALQRLDGKTMWQIYKNCIPLSGPAGGGAGQLDPSISGGSNTSQKASSTGDEDVSQTSPASKSDGDASKSDGNASKSDGNASKSNGDGSKSDTPSNDDASKSDTPSNGDSGSPSTPATPPPESDNTAPSPDTPEMAPAPSSKCNGRRRRRY